MFYFYLLAIFWFIRGTKSLLFWLYLWQLKEYHFGRFKAHFQTEKGRRLLVNKFLFLKFLLLIFLFLSLPYLPRLVRPSDWFGILPPILHSYQIWLRNLGIFSSFFLLFLYFSETYFVLKNFLQKRLKIPVLTKKTAILISAGLIVQALFLYLLFQGILMFHFVYFVIFAFWLLIFDIFSPIIFSALVLIFQPITVILRNRIIERARKKRLKSKNLLVIGITGSYGKSSTKEFLAAILETKFKVLKTKENHNSEIGISQCILQELKPEHEVFICEMAAYNKGGIKLLSEVINPKIGIVTGVNEQHLATFGSMENLLSAEGGGELIASLPKDGMAFFNAKNRYCQELYQKTKIKKFLYGENAFFSGEENILGAMIVAKELGMSEEEIFQIVKKIAKFPGIKIKKTATGLSVIDATYSANPTGVIAHLDYLKTWAGKKVIIMPCLIELGPASERVHQEIGEKIAEVDLAIIITKDKFKEIRQGAIKQGMKKENILFLENPQLIGKKLKEVLGRKDNLGSVVLLEGRMSKEISSLFYVSCLPCKRGGTGLT